MARAGASGFSPASISPTLWLDPIPGYLFQDTAGAVPVTANNDPVRRINARGSAFTLVAPSDAARPLYKTAGGLHWLESDGTDDTLVSVTTMASIISNSAYEMCIGGRFITIGTDSANGFSNDPILAESGGVVNAPFARSSGLIGAYNWDANNDVVTTAYTADTDFAWTQRHAGGTLFASLNGAAEISVASGNTTSLGGVLRLFAYTAGAYSNARFYGAVVKNAAITADERTALIAYMAAKGGVTL